jgi:hypothetical protein
MYLLTLGSGGGGKGWVNFDPSTHLPYFLRLAYKPYFASVIRFLPYPKCEFAVKVYGYCLLG